MTTYCKELRFETGQRREFQNLPAMFLNASERVASRRDCFFATHTYLRQSIINDDESGLHLVFEARLKRLAPDKPNFQYKHNGYEENGVLT